MASRSWTTRRPRITCSTDSPLSDPVVRSSGTSRLGPTFGRPGRNRDPRHRTRETSMKRFTRFLALGLAWLAADRPGAAAEPIRPEQLGTLQALIKPGSGEDRWAAI